MPVKALKKFTAWSYSRLTDYETCPLKARLKHLEKIKEPGSPAMDRGAAIDKLAEQYTTGVLTKLPDELKLFKYEFAALRKIKAKLQVQVNLALDARWQPVDWFAPAAWLRVKMDVFYDDLKKLARAIIDYKTGKIRDSHLDQLELYAVAAHAHAPEAIETFETSLWYLDQGETRPVAGPKVFTRDSALALRPVWTKRVRQMMADTTHAPRPSRECDWCFFGQAGKRQGGPGLCKF